MRRAYRSGARAAAPPAPPSPSLGHPTEGEPSTHIPPTIPGAFWFDSITEEIVRVIEAAGLTPADTQTQLRDAIRALAAASRPPAGIIEVYAGATAPAGYLECDGSAVSRTTYAALYAAIGTTYGAGDGSTTFALPDLRRRVVVGVGGVDASGGQLVATLGATGGAERVTLDETQMPIHAHSTVAAGGHTHGAGTYAAASAGSHRHDIPVHQSQVPASGADRTVQVRRDQSTDVTTKDGGAHAHTISGQSASGGGHRHTITAAGGRAGTTRSHPNLPPSIVLMYLISTGG